MNNTKHNNKREVSPDLGISGSIKTLKSLESIEIYKYSINPEVKRICQPYFYKFRV